MNELEQLNEEIKQLSERIEQLTNFVESTKAILKAAEGERDRLAAQQREKEPKFERVKNHEIYSYIILDGCGARAINDRDIDTGTDLKYFENNNYFHTRGRAHEVADKINFLLKLERLHDTFCPDYIPDWNNNNEQKYYVFYDNGRNRYESSVVIAVEYEPTVYFPTREIAQKVRDILNAEQEGKQNEAKSID